MLNTVGVESMAQLLDETIPADIRLRQPFCLGAHLPNHGLGESQTLSWLRQLASQNQVYRSYLGMGYAHCTTPSVIQRNIFENPGWYTQYTPYQAEIAQGRLEALLNFQTVIEELTGFAIANASLLDEATAAAEAMSMAHALDKRQRQTFVVSQTCHPQTIAVVQTRASALGWHIQVVDLTQPTWQHDDVFGVLAQYPDTYGYLFDLQALADTTHAQQAILCVACDPLSLTLLKPPAECGVDIAIGSAQRFGVPMGFGGPHAAFLATHEQHKRLIPGRIIGVSRDACGKPALRMALQTREQHIRRERATSNICTAQALLAIMAGMYAVYHGAEGLQNIARHVHRLTTRLSRSLAALGYSIRNTNFFDTLHIQVHQQTASDLCAHLAQHRFNVRCIDTTHIGITFDETSDDTALQELVAACARFVGKPVPTETQAQDIAIAPAYRRTSTFMQQEVFNRYRTEHEMLRYLHRLQSRDFSLAQGMIPLGSCTMKLNPTTAMLAASWPEFAALHPFAPPAQTQGYRALFELLEAWLCNITGFAAVSLQPNAGSQGEYAGLMVIRAFHRQRQQTQRSICLIPTSAHGTNPASAAMAGMQVVAVACDAHGNIDLNDLRAKAQKHKEALAALMVTYPSTHGVFEADIRQICDIIHQHGGQVYLDGANMNAQVGLCRPGDFGADVCHLNLHKTFAIPHGGGGPGMGPICVAEHLRDFLPQHPLTNPTQAHGIGAISAAAWGSASILTISWAYIAMMGADGLRQASALAILHANYMVARLQNAFPILYRGQSGRVAHEFILDLRPFKKSAQIEAEDVAKRLMDYGFHAPTLSFPVAGTLMIEPTESESLEEIDRFCEALLLIREEIRAIETNKIDAEDNPLKHAPHTAESVIQTTWTHPYARETAAYPAPWLRQYKFWPTVSRVDNAFGDRNLICSCPPMLDM